MTDAPFDAPFSVPLVETTRGPITENVHHGAAVVCTPAGEIVMSWGDPERTILPRSSCKMLQALPLVESGAADAMGLGVEHLALSCASHTATAAHVSRVNAWLESLGLAEPDLRCGVQVPQDKAARDAMRAAGGTPDQVCNNCSGKHTGFLTLGRRLGGGAEYHEIDHPVQKAVEEAIHEATGDPALGWGIDGCSAPNHATTLRGLAAAMARFARPEEGFGPGVRAAAAGRLRDAMMARPELVEGPGRACSELMKAAPGRLAAKSGADGMFTAILPESGYGVAVKIDGANEAAAACAMAAILAKLGVMDAADPAIRRWTAQEIRNRRDTLCGEVHPSVTLIGG
ncbi:asparaginase [Rhodovulum sp. DZ06]|uniref:asparaginase n=1 Tax=Rhodovulum sp. DZ06 TaxID=3425126 RepID=UPI003D3259EC